MQISTTNTGSLSVRKISKVNVRILHSGIDISTAQYRSGSLNSSFILFLQSRTKPNAKKSASSSEIAADVPDRIDMIPLEAENPVSMASGKKRYSSQ